MWILIRFHFDLFLDIFLSRLVNGDWVGCSKHSQNERLAIALRAHKWSFALRVRVFIAGFYSQTLSTQIRWFWHMSTQSMAGHAWWGFPGGGGGGVAVWLKRASVCILASELQIKCSWQSYLVVCFFGLTSNVWAGYSPRLLRARYSPATRRRFFAREPYYRSLMARLLKHK